MIIRNATVKWASILQPNTRFTPRWEVNVYPSEVDLKGLEAAGVAIKEDKESGEMYIKPTRKTQKQDGTPLSPPVVVDGQKQPWPENKLIGNGSVCNVIVALKEVNNFGTPGVKAYLNKVQVVHHIPYTGDEDFDVVDDPEAQAEAGEEEDF